MNLNTKMEKIINSSYNNIGGIVVRKKGKTVYEKYYDIIEVVNVKIRGIYGGEGF